MNLAPQSLGLGMYTILNSSYHINLVYVKNTGNQVGVIDSLFSKFWYRSWPICKNFEKSNSATVTGSSSTLLTINWINEWHTSLCATIMSEFNRLSHQGVRAVLVYSKQCDWSHLMWQNRLVFLPRALPNWILCFYSTSARVNCDVEHLFLFPFPYIMFTFKNETSVIR